MNLSRETLSSFEKSIALARQAREHATDPSLKILSEAVESLAEGILAQLKTQVDVVDQPAAYSAGEFIPEEGIYNRFEA